MNVGPRVYVFSVTTSTNCLGTYPPSFPYCQTQPRVVDAIMILSVGLYCCVTCSLSPNRQCLGVIEPHRCLLEYKYSITPVRCRSGPVLVSILTGMFRLALWRRVRPVLYVMVILALTHLVLAIACKLVFSHELPLAHEYIDTAFIGPFLKVNNKNFIPQCRGAPPIGRRSTPIVITFYLYSTFSFRRCPFPYSLASFKSCDLRYCHFGSHNNRSLAPGSSSKFTTVDYTSCSRNRLPGGDPDRQHSDGGTCPRG